MRLIKKTLMRALGLLAIMVAMASNAEAKTIIGEEASGDSVKVDNLLSKAREALRDGRFDNTKNVSSEALLISKKISYLSGEANSSFLLGAAYRAVDDYNESLKHYLSALKGYEILGDNGNTISVNGEIGGLYQDQGAYLPAVNYFNKALKKAKEEKSNDNLKLSLLQNIAYSYEQLEDYDKTLMYYKQILALHEKAGDQEQQIRVYKQLGRVSQMNGQYRSAQKYNMELASIYEKRNDIAGISTAYNNLGYIYKRTGDIKSSADYFTKVANMAYKQSKDISDDDKAVLLTNMGVAYTNLKTYVRAKENYLSALRLREKIGDEVGIANAKNYLAGGYYVSGNNSQALKAVTEAIVIGEEKQDEEVLMTSYKILSLINDKENNLTKAKKYMDMHKALKQKLDNDKNEKKKLILQKQLEIEKNEEEIRTLLAEEERVAVESERKQNELILREKELDLLKRDQELREVEYKNQLLEKERTEQALTMARQQLEAEKRERELASLEKEKELQDLELQRKELEDEQQEKAIQLLEADKKLQDEQLQRQETARKFTMGLLALAALILMIIIFSFIQKRKANKKLKEKQFEIEEKNEELLQNMEELQTIQEALGQQKDKLEVQNQKVTQSIQYAQRIQSSILPSASTQKNLFPDSFVTYLPKDIVSGDFYWMTEKNGKRIVSVIDCTGHGVPGSLMSMVGSNTLNELVNQSSILNPAEILNNLHLNIRQKLSQKESQNHDGMDLGICLVEDLGNDKFKLVYAGAKHTLYIMSNGELIEVEGDRKSIGGANTEETRDYSNKEIVLEKGATLYLTTDGFIDQNCPNRKRFNKRRFKDLIEDINALSIGEQKDSLEKALSEHQQEAEQRDDITVIGVKI